MHLGGFPARGGRGRGRNWKNSSFRPRIGGIPSVLLVLWRPKNPGFPCFSRKSRYIPRHLTRKHGSKGRPVAAGPLGSSAHTFPEEPTGELDDGTTRFLYASAT